VEVTNYELWALKEVWCTETRRVRERARGGWRQSWGERDFSERVWGKVVAYMKEIVSEMVQNWKERVGAEW
jgi:hypothetical protein